MHINLLVILLTGFTLQTQPEDDSLRSKLVRIEHLRSNFSQDTTHFRILVNLTRQTNNWEQARNYWQQAIDVAEKRKWTKGLLESYQGIGLHYRRKGSFIEAAHYFQLGLYLSERNNDYAYQINSYQSLGLVYSMAGDTTKSFHAFRTALKLAGKTNRSQYLDCLNEMGNAYLEAKLYAKALNYYQQCLQKNIAPVDSIRQCWFLTNIADTYKELNKLDSSLITFKELFRYGRFLSKGDSIVTYAHLAQLYVKMGKPDQGLIYGHTAEKMMLHVNSKYFGSVVHHMLFEAYEAKKDWEKAFFHERKFHVYKDSLFLQEQRQKLEGIQIGYESEKHRSELALVKGKMKVQKQVNQLLQVGFILSGLLVGVLIFFIYLLRNRRKKIEFQKNEISIINNSLENRVKERTSELESANKALIQKNREIAEALVKGQTLERKRVASELHDNLGGTLIAIQWYMQSLLHGNRPKGLKDSGYNDLYQMISRAYGEVRLLAHHMMPDVLEKEGLEVALHELAIPINKSKRLYLTVDTKQVSPFLDTGQKFELYSIALELCSNILKHAQASDAHLQLDFNEQEITMSVTDNGIGLPDRQQNQTMGLKNIQSRLETIGGYCTLRSAPGEGTTVLITVPFKFSEEIARKNRS